MSALLEVAGLQSDSARSSWLTTWPSRSSRVIASGWSAPTARGKSSVFNLITGTIEPDGGTIRFEGRDLSRLPSHLRARRGIVRAFQIPQPFPHLTVYENVLAASSFGAGRSGSEASAAALAVLEAMGLMAKASMLAGQLPLLDRKRLELGKAVECSPFRLLTAAT